MRDTTTRHGGPPCLDFRAGLAEGREEAARFLLGIGYGVDFESGARPGVEVLEAMVRQAAEDPLMVQQFLGEGGADEVRPVADRLEEAYFVLSEELGEWR